LNELGLQFASSIPFSNMQHDCIHNRLEELDELEGEGGQILSLQARERNGR